MLSKVLTVALVVAVLACVDASALAQQPPASAVPSPVGDTGRADYQVGPGDLLSIRVTGVREFDHPSRVANSGRIRVPYVGIMFVAGMTTLEIEREIARQITEHELVNEPAVRVQVDQFRARPAYIVGEVVTPGQFVISNEMYVLDLIARAGGLAATADATAILYRGVAERPSVTARFVTGPAEPDAAPAPGSPEPTAAPAAPDPTPAAPDATPAAAPDSPSGEGQGEAKVIPINLNELRDGTRPELNMALQGGDILFVPRRKGRTFFIIGDVRAPGAYMMPQRGAVSASQAIIYAGGPLMTAKNRSGFLMRHDETGKPQAIPIDFLAIVKGKKPDIVIQDEDIIFIPNSAAKTVGVGLLLLMPRLLQQFLIF
jgi:polysaccharide export outer membrane protein